MNIATIEVLAILAQRKSRLFEKIEELFYPNKKIAHKVQFSNIQKFDNSLSIYCICSLNKILMMIITIVHNNRDN